MRTALLALGSVAAGLVATWAAVEWRVDLPPVGPRVEQLCVETMQRRSPDHSWTTSHRGAHIGDRAIPTVTLGELPFLHGGVVRVAGVLHVEFEHVALYPSRAAMQEQPWQAPWVALHTLWPYEPYWHTKGPSVSDRCVLLEARYSSGRFGFGSFPGALTEVHRLDVWATPHRPLVRTVPSPAPPRAESSCSEAATPPKRVGGDAARRALFAELRTLYASGEFGVGACVAHVEVDEEGRVDAVRVVRPRDADPRVATLLERSLQDERYRAARACGRPVPFRLTVSLVHCPVRAEH